MESILWRRLDAPGHDACRLEPTGNGWRLEGAAAFSDPAGPACLLYEADCDRHWRTREGRATGWVAARRIDLRVQRTAAGDWTLNGSVIHGLEECVDLDFGFTPATNLFQLRRLALAERQASACAVAWLDIDDGGLSVLQQRYERRDADTYWYEAPRFGYAAALHVDATGFVRRYPRLWEAEG